MELSEIKKELLSGDLKYISEHTGYSYEMVCKVLNGTRTNELIIEACKMRIANNKSLAEQISLMANVD